MEFRKIARDGRLPNQGRNTAYLRVDYWNDFSFVTQFYVCVHNELGELHDIGNIKIGFRGQTEAVSTHSKLPDRFDSLDDNYFSLGGGSEFYRNLSFLSPELKATLLSSLRDLVYSPALIDEIRGEEVFSISLMRGENTAAIKGKYQRVLNGQPELTDFDFRFVHLGDSDLSAIEIDFSVVKGGSPSTNVHAIIGQNGVGKTTLVNSMINAVVRKDPTQASFFKSSISADSEIDVDYFSGLVSVSFSAFDQFTPPAEQPDPAKGTCYSYVGLKDQDDGGHRDISELRRDTTSALISCFSRTDKLERWTRSIDKLGFDDSFSLMDLHQLKEIFERTKEEVTNGEGLENMDFLDAFAAQIDSYLKGMSSGHAIVLLTITHLVATVDERTFVVLDEPESHLHPPLLSAFIRALSDLLHDRNGVALIATHSPVILQEIPKTCVWKLHRSHDQLEIARPNIETFGENVGILTSEVFGLEVVRSGFYDLLSHSVDQGLSYDEILQAYNGQLGMEGRAVLKALLVEQGKN